MTIMSTNGAFVPIDRWKSLPAQIAIAKGQGHLGHMEEWEAATKSNLHVDKLPKDDLDVWNMSW